MFQQVEHKTMERASSINNLNTMDNFKFKTLNRTLTKTKDQPSSFGVEEIVNVINDKEKIKALQMLHGRWIEDMEITVGREGIVRYISNNGDVGVEIEGVRWFFNPKCLTKEDFVIGDIVRVIVDEIMARKLQYGLGEWSDTLLDALGKKGQVINVYPDGCIEVFINGKSWVFNPKCLIKKNEILSYNRDESVRLINDLGNLKLIQGTGRWKEGMKKLVGKHGRVISTLSNGDIQVAVEGECWIFMHKCIYKSNEPKIKYRVGDHVRVNKDEFQVRKMQEQSQLWIEDMVVILGKKGVISRLYRDGSARVEIEAVEWNMNPDCLILCK